MLTECCRPVACRYSPPWAVTVSERSRSRRSTLQDFRRFNLRLQRGPAHIETAGTIKVRYHKGPVPVWQETLASFFFCKIFYWFYKKQTTNHFSNIWLWRDNKHTRGKSGDLFIQKVSGALQSVWYHELALCQSDTYSRRNSFVLS